MKKVYKGAVYNTETAKKLCEIKMGEHDNDKGSYVNQIKQLYRTKSANYFFYIQNHFSTYVDVNGDDINPKYELTDVVEEKLIPIQYDLALQFATEALLSDPILNKGLIKMFPELNTDGEEKNRKIPKKVYISEKANWYLEMMITESEDTNSSFIEKLIVDEYQKLYRKGIMQSDPYHEMDEEKNK